MIDSTNLVVALVAVAAGFYYFVLRKPAAPEKKRTFVVPPKKSANVISEADQAQLAGRPKLLVLFASQTGTAEEYARRVGLQGKLYKFNPTVKDIEDIEPSDIKDWPLVVILAATYGEGEPTDSARAFHDWVKEDHGDVLSETKFGVFGLGNKTYKHFNAIGRLFDERLAALGADRVVKYGEGDDDGCMEDDFRAWEKILWPALTSKFGIDVSDIGSLDDQAVEYSYKIVYHDRETPAGKAGATPPESKGLEAKALTYFSKVTTVRELHNKAVSDRSCVHVELDISDCPLSYEAGDHVAVYPRNDPEVVRALCERLGYDRSAVFQLVMDKKDGPRKRFPVYCSVDSALGYYCDLTSAATVRFLKGCSELAEDEAEKAALKALGSTSDEGRARYTKEVLEPYLSVGDVLARFKSVKLPLECFLELVSPLLPRYYSVASSPRAHPRALHLCASVVKYTTPGGRTSHGVATRHLSHLKEGDVCIVSVRRSAFKLPTRKAQPVIMIGPGTGLAPFRGFLQERSIALAQSATDHTPRPGKMILFNGCRRPDEDHIYADELAQYEKEGLVEVHTAFSRLDSEKVYVQHLLAKHGKDVWAALDKGASVYVCGDASHMAKDVDKALRALIKEAGGKTQDEADNYVKMLLDNNRYAQDVW